jgi:5-methylcytosine-specific restriction endonuclease McrA
VDGLTREEVKAILDAREARRRVYVDKALALVAVGQWSHARRQSVPADVRRLVFLRDRGRCTSCGTADSLEYGHVSPRSLGGSSASPENIRLECRTRNRRRGIRLDDG